MSFSRSRFLLPGCEERQVDLEIQLISGKTSLKDMFADLVAHEMFFEQQSPPSPSASPSQKSVQCTFLESYEKSESDNGWV